MQYCFLQNFDFLHCLGYGFIKICLDIESFIFLYKKISNIWRGFWFWIM